jgi:hypothetical protein
MNETPQDHADFPVLTEGLDPPGLPGAPEVDWARLALQVERQVSERLMERCHELLEEQIPETLAPLLARAAEQISQDLRSALPLMVRNLVVTAVAEELDRLNAATTNDRP